MAEHRYIKIPKINSIFNSKAQAIEKIVRYIENHLDDFHDGESLLVRFRGDKGDIVSANVFVNVNEESEVTLSFGLDSSETIRVVESEEERGSHGECANDIRAAHEGEAALESREPHAV